MEIICFHNPNEENGYLSNWYTSYFVVDDIRYSSVEQYMMYQKARCFCDTNVAKEIMKTDDVAVIKLLGRSVSNYDDDIWSSKREKVVLDGAIAKFSQNIDLKKQLLDTKDAILAECAIKDLIWGIGLSMKDINRFDIKKWRGKNLLGYTLMQVRDKLR